MVIGALASRHVVSY